MNNYSDRIQSHPIQNTILNMESSVIRIESNDSIKEESIEHLERVKAILNLVKKLLSQDPVFIAQIPLNNINSFLQNSLSELNNYENNKNVAHLLNVNSFLDSILIHLSQINFISSISPTDYSDNLVSFRRSAGQYAHYIEEEYKNLRSTYSKLEEQYISLKNNIENQIKRVDTAINNFQIQFSETESKRSSTFNNSEIKRTESFNLQLSTQNDSFIKSSKEQFEASHNLIKQFEDESNNLLYKINSDTENLILNLQQKKDDAERLVNVIANVGMAGGYQKVANEARKSKRMWQFFTSVALVGLISFAIIAFMNAVSAEFNLGSFGARLFAAISFGVLAAYTAREAEKSSNSEAKNRQIELELASIDLYLEKLPEEKQIALKTELAKKWFGNLPIIEKSSKDNFNGNSFELIKMVLNNLSKIK